MKNYIYLQYLNIITGQSSDYTPGGQPLHHGDYSILKARRDALYREDSNKEIRKSHDNPEIIKLYEDFLGAPCGDKAHLLLHTHYFDKSKEIIKE